MISFVIPAYNEEAILGQTLSILREAARPIGEPFEIVVADDASTDGTRDIASEHGVKLVTAHHRQIAATRNSGAQAATGEMLIFVDADTQVTEAAIRAAVEAMRAGAVGGGTAFRFDGNTPLYGRILLVIAVRAYRILGLASGCFLFCTRSAFHAVGGFDERLFCGEEAAFSRALGRHGRFVVLGEYVTTSGRKLRTFSTREVVGLVARLVIMGPKFLYRREGLDVWYGERRIDQESLALHSAPVIATQGETRGD